MSDGMGCKCAAWSANECSCPDVDWRSAREVELEAENKALRKDAERYRWLRDVKFRHNGHCFALTGQILWETNLDAAIDAAMKGK